MASTRPWLSAGGTLRITCGRASHGFAIPPTATIRGVLVEALLDADGPITDYTARLMKAGAPVGSERGRSGQMI